MLKEIQDFFKVLQIDDKTGFAPVPKSTAFISPGDILFFHYRSNQVTRSRIVLVVSNESGQGIYSKYDKLFLSCFNLHDSDPQVVKIILKTLYNNKGAANYYSMKAGLGSLLGMKSYRTYELNKMQGTYKVKVNVELY